MKIQILYIVTILSILVFENYLLAAAKRKTGKTKQELALENARLSVKVRELEFKSGISEATITRTRTISEDVILSDGDLEMGIRQSSAAYREDFIEFNRGISNNLNRLTDVHAQQTDFQKKVYSDMKCSRRIIVLSTITGICYTTAGFIWQNWPTISKYLGGHHGTPGGGTNSTGV
jgi:hypothetical protein